MDDVPTSDFGHLLRRLRRQAELTQEELAERAGLSVRAIGDLERGMRRAPYRATVQQLADALHLSTDERARLLAASRRRIGPNQQQSPSPVMSSVTSIVGRSREIAEVESFFTSSPVRLVTLTGPGGVGKTRLALEIADRLRSAPFESILLVPLAPVRESAFLEVAIEQALDGRAAPGGSVRERLVARLHDRRILLVLDNFEHLLTAAGGVAELLSVCPTLKILTTSRAPLHLRAEQEYPVPPLAAPNLLDAPPLEKVRAYPAVELFVQRAMAVKPGFHLAANNALAVAQICHRLDGLPLAIELAAARINVLPPQALLEQLTAERGLGAMKILAAGHRDVPARLQTMRNAISWTYDYLPPDRQTLFRQLAAFVGGASLAAIQAVCFRDDDAELSALNLVSNLVDQSLLRLEEQPDGQARFTMLETIREFALERLDTCGETDSVRTRHAQYFAAFVDTLSAGKTQQGQVAKLELLDREDGNLRAALSWLMLAGAGEAALRLATALCEFWTLRQYFAEGARWMEQVLALGGQDVALRARGTHGLAILLQHQGEYGRAAKLLREAVDLFKQLGDASGVGWTLLTLAYLVHDQGEFEHSASLYMEALDCFQEQGDAAGVAQALAELASVRADQGEYELAEQLYIEGLAASRAVEDTRAVSIALQNLGDLAVRQELYDRAIELFAESIEIRRILGDEPGIAIGLLNLGEATWLQGNRDRAAPILIESLRESHRLGHRRTLAFCLVTVAAFTAARGTPTVTARLWGAAEALCETMAIAIPPDIRSRYESVLVAPKTELGADAWSLACDLGRSMTVDRAVECAIREHEAATSICRTSSARVAP